MNERSTYHVRSTLWQLRCRRRLSTLYPSGHELLTWQARTVLIERSRPTRTWKMVSPQAPKQSLHFIFSSCSMPPTLFRKRVHGGGCHYVWSFTWCKSECKLWSMDPLLPSSRPEAQCWSPIYELTSQSMLPPTGNYRKSSLHSYEKTYDLHSWEKTLFKYLTFKNSPLHSISRIRTLNNPTDAGSPPRDLSQKLLHSNPKQNHPMTYISSSD